MLDRLDVPIRAQRGELHRRAVVDLDMRLDTREIRSTCLLFRPESSKGTYLYTVLTRCGDDLPAIKLQRGDTIVKFDGLKDAACAYIPDLHGMLGFTRQKREGNVDEKTYSNALVEPTTDDVQLVELKTGNWSRMAK